MTNKHRLRERDPQDALGDLDAAGMLIRDLAAGTHDGIVPLEWKDVDRILGAIRRAADLLAAETTSFAMAGASLTNTEE
jgi:hypothetical protein